MSEDKAVAEPVDDATIVNDPVANEEKIHEELVEAVTKKLEKENTPEQSEKPDGMSEQDGTSEQPEKSESTDTSEESAEGPELTQELKSRAEKAGISSDLAERLHQAGQLEDVVAMSDRRMMEYIRSKPKKEEPAEKVTKTDDVPALDPEVYDEELVKRDAYQQKRIEALEAKLEGLLGSGNDGFDEWFDSTVDSLGHEDLFGKGTSVPRSKQSKRDALFQAYQDVCEVYGVNPDDRNEEMAQFALKAEFRDELKKLEDKEKQKKQLERARDASGKFLSSPKSKAAPPPKNATEEEVHEHLVSNVTTYLKEQGVHMSGF